MAPFRVHTRSFMRSLPFPAMFLSLVLGLVSCSRDPQVVKKRYFESGNKYFARGRYNEASIQYRNALRQDPKYGAAHYKLALTSLQKADYVSAVGQLRRAVELLSTDSPDHWDALVKLTEILLQVATSDKSYMDEVKKYTSDLMKRDPNSFDAHRLTGDLNYAQASQAYQTKKNEEGRKFLETAIAEYRKADSIKP